MEISPFVGVLPTKWLNNLRIWEISPLVGAYDGDSPPSHAQLARLLLNSSSPACHHGDDCDNDEEMIMS